MERVTVHGRHYELKIRYETVAAADFAGYDGGSRFRGLTSGKIWHKIYGTYAKA